MKLFNLPLRELGPMFLEHGILVSGSTLKDVLATHVDDFRKKCGTILVDNQKINMEQFREMDWENEYIFLQVKEPS
jgi:hypothetical protein